MKFKKLIFSEKLLQFLNKLTSREYATTLGHLINNFTTYDEIKHYGAYEDLRIRNEHGTGHISILARNGDAVSVTTSINF